MIIEIYHESATTIIETDPQNAITIIEIDKKHTFIPSISLNISFYIP